ncbi:MAG: biotin--[acetyl-CoA-carboxylase] ligase [Solirubrobacterales bacterium]|nr:biotin--[acetyl-CoA-carboxylase] ligase [Solirubrobacterales bacterium]
MSLLGHPRVHYRLTGSTNARARELAGAGAPHGTLVTADEQSEGRGRQGRTWSAAAGRALLCSVVIRDPPALLPLAAGVAVAEVVGEVVGAQGAGAGARLKWPNDVLVAGRKVAGILVEGRPQEGWAVVGIGLNVALRQEDFPPELRSSASGLGLDMSAVEPTLSALLERLERWVAADAGSLVDAVRALDALLGQPVRWAGGHGVGAGIDAGGRLLVETESGTVALDAGEVHLLAGA